MDFLGGQDRSAPAKDWNGGGDPFLTSHARSVRTSCGLEAQPRDPRDGPSPKPKWYDCSNLPNPVEYLNDFAVLLALIFVPWSMLVLIACLFAFVYHSYQVFVWVVCVVCLLIALGFFMAGGSKAGGMAAPREDRGERKPTPFTRQEYYMPSVYMVLSVLCAIAVFFGIVLGYWSYHSYMWAYWSYRTNGEYTNVMPSEPAIAHADAGKIIFSDFTRVDTAKAAGFKDGTVYCVAPIMDDVPMAKVEYWAVGTDCCMKRADFNCDDAWNPKAKSGMVVMEANPWIPNNRESYEKAVRLAEATYEIVSAKQPLFVRWVAEPEVVQDDFWRSGIGFLVAELSIYFLASVIFGLISAGAVQRSARNT